MVVTVRFKYGNKGGSLSAASKVTIQAAAKTESAVMAALQKHYPNRDMVILEIK
ncbi:Uncharacterised protein [Kingella potus]|uniref:Uncharacterized protein n=1 Tax=Kingella potus TaxID=265175 RepID=A0A377R3T7_9NEIS|nr:hypothetical protein [Kingella potus]UOP00720.1 hypothetical protein LVJ84_13170 [Kingella potus]STR02884.1 Uncharacterised protein [Kingella potus]